jgi:hypothetical protein
MVKFRVAYNGIDGNQYTELRNAGYIVRDIVPKELEISGKTAWLLRGTLENTLNVKVAVIELTWPDAQLIATGRADLGSWIAITGSAVTMPDGSEYFEVKNLGKYPPK